jgi:cation transport ATPase
LFVVSEGGRRLRLISGIIQILFQVVLILTGNYGFFNYLTIVLCIPLFDDFFILSFIRIRKGLDKQRVLPKNQSSTNSNVWKKTNYIVKPHHSRAQTNSSQNKHQSGQQQQQQQQQQQKQKQKQKQKQTQQQQQQQQKQKQTQQQQQQKQQQQKQKQTQQQQNQQHSQTKHKKSKTSKSNRQNRFYFLHYAPAFGVVILTIYLLIKYCNYQISFDSTHPNNFDIIIFVLSFSMKFVLTDFFCWIN